MKNGLIVTVFLSLLALPPQLSAPAFAGVNLSPQKRGAEAGAADTEEQKLGDQSDGSRAASYHLIPLFAENQDGEKGAKITPADDLLLPFSTKWTCEDCHSYATISSGWHFNAVDQNAVSGRQGQPWIFVDAATGTQIPLSYRPWHGVFKPEQLGLTPRQFTKLFGRHTPGGGAGELESKDPNEFMRESVSGKLEINCLTCHNSHPGQNQGGADGYAEQIAKENFRWASAASCEFAAVRGSAADMPDTYDPFLPVPPEDPKKIPPAVTYDKNRFDSENKVFFDIVRKVPNERCYFCHSNLDVGNNQLDRWAADEDVHLMAGLMCVDCHRQGLDHNTIRGYEGESPPIKSGANPIVNESSCEGCHNKGRLGAPVPKHPGIPPIHFDKLSCTACHSGPWPAEKTILTKTSRAHRLGTANVNKSPQALPHIVYPVFARQAGIGVAYIAGLLVINLDCRQTSLDGKIAPHKLIWPAFWGSANAGKVTPIELEIVRQTVGEVLADVNLPSSGDWPALTAEQICEGLKALQKSIKEKVVYISGGKLHQVDDQGKLTATEHYAARPYLWPVAHNVRPAAQSLGVNGCEDCHSIDAPLLFGKVAIDSPIVAERDDFCEMIEFQDINRTYNWLFAFTFVFRPWLKVIVIGCSCLLAGILLLFALRALACVIKVLAGKNL